VPATRSFDFFDYQNEGAEGTFPAHANSLARLDEDGELRLSNPLDGARYLYLQAGLTTGQLRALAFLADRTTVDAATGHCAVRWLLGALADGGFSLNEYTGAAGAETGVVTPINFSKSSGNMEVAGDGTGAVLLNVTAGTATNGVQFGDGAGNAVATVSGAGAAWFPAMTMVTDATDTRVCTSADYGKIIKLTHADTVAVTLPANGAAAGSWIDFMLAGNDSLAVTISAATVDTLIGPNDAELDSVTWGAGHRIGAYARFISDGTKFHVLNLGGTTMTYNS
jgi:hypothetical protein